MEKYHQLSTTAKRAAAVAVLAAAAALLWLNSNADPSNVTLISNFDENDEQWSVLNGRKHAYHASKGAPNGHISAAGRLKNQTEKVAIDLVIAIDNISSMSSAIHAVHNDAKKLIEAMGKRTNSLHLGIVTITDIADSKAPIPTSDLSDDIPTQLTHLDNIGSTSGGNAPEDVPTAILEMT